MKQLHISTLNIQGLSKYENDIQLKEFISQFDIIELCETWGENSSDFSGYFEGYCSFSDVRAKKRNAIRGSGGITVFVKESLVSENIVKRICTDLKECVVLLLDGAKFVNQCDIIFFFTYVAPQYSSYVSNPAENGIDILSEKLLRVTAEFENADSVLAGDLNARTKDFLDYIVEDDVDYIFGENNRYPADSFCLPRQSKDMHAHNAFGLSLVVLCCAFDIHIMNGRLFDDTEGNFTCFTNNGTSIVDFIIASSSLFSKVCQFNIAELDLSDHVPVCCTFNFEIETQPNDENGENINLNKWVLYKWNPNLKEPFLHKFRDLYNDFQNTLNNSDASVSTLLPDFIEVFQKAAISMRHVIIIVKSKIRKSHHGGIKTAQRLNT